MNALKLLRHTKIQSLNSNTGSRGCWLYKTSSSSSSSSTTTVLQHFVQKKHSPTNSHLSWSSTIIYQLPPSTMTHSTPSPCSIYVLDSFFSQPCSKSSLVYLLVWNSPLYIPYISSPNHCLLFTTHTHTITTCFALPPRLCELFLVSLLTLYFEFFFYSTLMSHIYLTILISALWSASYLIFFPYRPRLTSMQHTISHTTTVQSPSHSQWYIHTGKQWFQVPEFIPSNSNSGLYSCFSISIRTQHVT